MLSRGAGPKTHGEAREGRRQAPPRASRLDNLWIPVGAIHQSRRPTSSGAAWEELLEDFDRSRTSHPLHYYIYTMCMYIYIYILVLYDIYIYICTLGNSCAGKPPPSCCMPSDGRRRPPEEGHLFRGVLV